MITKWLFLHEPTITYHQLQLHTQVNCGTKYKWYHTLLQQHCSISNAVRLAEQCCLSGQAYIELISSYHDIFTYWS